MRHGDNIFTLQMQGPSSMAVRERYRESSLKINNSDVDSHDGVTLR